VQNAAGFAFLQTTVFNKLTLLPGIRTEWNERSGWEILPQLNLSYPYQKLLFRATAGKTARNADFTERFNNYQRMNVPSGLRIGNPDLAAENAISYEAGADFNLNDNFKISATLFGRNHTDLIDWIRTPYANMPRKTNLIPTGSYDLASNVAEVNTLGTELDIHYFKSFGKHSLQIGLGAVWMESNSSDTTPSLYVSNHARWLINLYAAYRYKAFGISVNGLYKERNFLPTATGLVPLTPSYFLVNAKADVQLLNDKMILFVQADNLFNQSYSDILGSVMPNRWLMGGVKLMID
jgi:iron complex outermembrane receptor protein